MGSGRGLMKPRPFRCWLRVDNYFIWSFIGPVAFVILVSGGRWGGAVGLGGALGPAVGLRIRPQTPPR